MWGLFLYMLLGNVLISSFHFHSFKYICPVFRAPLIEEKPPFIIMQATLTPYDRRLACTMIGQLVSCIWLFVTPWTSACEDSLSFTISMLRLVSIESVMPSSHLMLCRFLLLPASIFPSMSFQMSQFFASGSRSFGVSASASVLPMNIQDWFPFRLTGWISLQSKGLSRVFSNTTIQKHQFLCAQLSL